MTQEDKQWNLEGVEFDIWDQQVDESEDEWNARLERMRVEAEDPVKLALDKGFDAWMCACGWAGNIADMTVNASGGRVCPGCGASGALLLAMDVPFAQWGKKLSEAIVATGAIRISNPYDPLPGETDTQYDQRVDQQRDEGVTGCDGSAMDEAVVFLDQGQPIPETLPEIERVTVCDVPSSPMTLEALQEMAATALANIKGSKPKKSKSVMSDVHEEDVGWVQESFIPAHCVNEGGSGLECMMCNGQACRFCGFGCWDREAPRCEHEVEFRHSWDPVAEERRLALQEAEMKVLGISEARRQEMMNKIFDGDPSLTHMIYCKNCNQEVRTGEVVYVTSKGTYHSRNCTAQNEPEAEAGGGANASP